MIAAPTDVNVHNEIDHKIGDVRKTKNNYKLQTAVVETRVRRNKNT
jgi:hypothetical protein